MHLRKTENSQADAFVSRPGTDRSRCRLAERNWRRWLTVWTGYLAICCSAAMCDEPRAIDIPTGKTITPTAAAGAIFQDLNPELAAAPDMRASHAAAMSVSPDGRVLAILTAGYNLRFGRDGNPIPELSMEHVFLFDITGPRPRQFQALAIPNTFQGLAWAPSSDTFFASGGKDDTVLEFGRRGRTFSATRTFRLGHQAAIGLDAKPMAGALAVSPDGTRLLVANFQNDSVSLIDLKSGQLLAEQDLRPGVIDARRQGEPGGSFPRSVAWISGDHAYVASERDREVVSLAVSGSRIQLIRRMAVHGQPVALLANRKGSRLYAALDNTDHVVIFDTADDKPIEAIDVAAAPSVYTNVKRLGGANSNALALTPDESTLLVSNGAENAIAVVRLGDRARDFGADPGASHGDDDDEKRDVDQSAVVGLVPTGWYPTGVATSKDGAQWYVVNGKSATGANAGWCRSLDPARGTCLTGRPPDPHATANGVEMLNAQNQQQWQLQKAGLLTLPAPSTFELARLTKQVARNDHFDRPEMDAKDQSLFGFLRNHIRHVIYIIKENRTYDQVLGDLEVGNGDPRLTLFPESLSPNHHAIARRFVTLDNFLVSGEGSTTGWDWSVSAHTNDFRERQDLLNLAGRGLDLDYFGSNRNINTGYATSAERNAEFSFSPFDPDVLPGARDVTAFDGPGGEEGKGHIWDAVLRKGLTVRNYGFWGMGMWKPVPPYDPYPPLQQLVRDPFAQKLRVFFSGSTALKPLSDPYYRSFDRGFPDYWRYREWKREFDAYSVAGVAPNLMLIVLGNDHFGNFERAIDGVDTVDTQMADNDYALGLIIEAVSNSPFANDTLVISIEDDACDGPDHVDAFRSVALFAGAYVRQHQVVSARYTTVSVVKTIEEILGVGPIGLDDALAAPMSDVFDPKASAWSYRAVVPDVLRSTQLPLPQDEHAKIAFPRRSAAYWTAVMAGQDFSGPDRVDPVTFNRALWRGLTGNSTYPVVRRGAESATNFWLRRRNRPTPRAGPPK